MGWYPTQDVAEWPADARAPGTPEENGTPDDGWRFVKCPLCKGTGRVSWWISLARVPRWIVRGTKTTWRFTVDRYMIPPDWSLWQRFKLAVWCGFGSDIVAIIRRY
jgi:hypothetical protein